MQSTALGSVSNNRNKTGSSASVPKARRTWSHGEVEKQGEGNVNQYILLYCVLTRCLKLYLNTKNKSLSGMKKEFLQIENCAASPGVFKQGPGGWRTRCHE